jgi:hypothetical protein
MSRFAPILAILAVAATPASAIDLPDDTADRAVACLVYGAWAPPGDPRSEEAKRAIEATIEDAVARGIRTRAQVNDLLHETTSIALYGDPRAELTENWNECRASFAPV